MYRYIAPVFVAILLAGCAVNPLTDHAQAIQAAEAAGRPLLIYGRPEINALSFVNTSGHTIKTIGMKVVLCGLKGQTSADMDPPFWVDIVFEGPFKSGQAYDVVHAPSAAVDAHDRAFNAAMWDFGQRSKVVVIQVEYADGTQLKSYSDPSQLMTPSVSDYCPKHYVGMAGMPRPDGTS